MQSLQQTGHRTIAIQVTNARLLPAPVDAASALQVQLSRANVQAHMAARYGFELDDAAVPTEAAPSGLSPSGLPPSATERRIAGTLEAAVAKAAEQTLQELTQDTPPVKASAQNWQWQADLQIGQQAAQPMRVLLGSAHSASLERYARSQRRTGQHSAQPASPLLISLQAQLVEKTVSAAEIQQLRLGSVLPITLDRARVTLNGEPMLSASVAEHHGKLHLTAFETLE